VNANQARALLTYLNRAGFTVWVHGSSLRVGPASRLTAELRTEVRRYRAQLVELVGVSSPWVPESEWTSDERWMVNMLKSGAWFWKLPAESPAGRYYIPLVRIF
jgi:hypothetical protein